MKCITHTYRKIDEKEEPKCIFKYTDIGREVGVFACKCVICGKKKDMKFDMPINQCM